MDENRHYTEVITSWKNFLSWYSRNKGIRSGTKERWVFRGEGNAEWHLSTTIERQAKLVGIDPTDLPGIEQRLIREFRRHVHHYLQDIPSRSDIAANNNKRSKRIATPLTEANRSDGRDPYRKKHTRGKRKPKFEIKTCRECGKRIEKERGEFCSKRCWKAYNKALVVPKLADAGPKNLAVLRAAGKDPSHGGEAAKERGQSNVRRSRERKEWESDHPGINLEDEKKRYRQEILPHLTPIPLSRIMGATGFSKRYASMIRRDLYTPHPMHYQKLEELILLYNETSGG